MHACCSEAQRLERRSQNLHFAKGFLSRIVSTIHLVPFDTKLLFMLKFMLCCQGDPNCPRFPAPVQPKRYVHLSCLLAPAWSCIGTTSARLRNHRAFHHLKILSFTTCTSHHLQPGVWAALLLRPAHPVQVCLVACQGKSTRVFCFL